MHVLASMIVESLKTLLKIYTEGEKVLSPSPAII